MSQPQTRLEHVLQVGQQTNIAQLPSDAIARILTSHDDASVCKAVRNYCAASLRACTDETYDEIIFRLNMRDANEQLILNVDSRGVFKLLCRQLHSFLGPRRQQAFSRNRAVLGRMLARAAERRLHVLCFFLLKRGASTDEDIEDDMMPIHFATKNADLKLIKLLHEHGAALDEERSFTFRPDMSSYETPLMMLIQNVESNDYEQTVACVKFMLKHLDIQGINITYHRWYIDSDDESNMVYQNALCFAIRAEKNMENPKMVKLILQKPGMRVIGNNMTVRDIAEAFKDDDGNVQAGVALDLVNAKMNQQIGSQI